MKKNPMIHFLSVLLLFCGCQQTEKKTTYPDGFDAAPRHVRVIWTEQPSHHAIISWSTLFEKGNENVVYYDTVPRLGRTNQYAFQMKAKRNGEITMLDMDFTEGVPPGYFHHSEINDLLPLTKYFFVVETDGQISDEYYFITAPKEDRTLAVLWGGDSRLGGINPVYAGNTPHIGRQNMNRVIAGLIDRQEDIFAFLHGADYAKTAEWRHLFWWFEDHQLVKGKDNRLLPLVISRGNHDEAIGFLENFWLGNLSDKNSFNYYFHTRFTPEVSIITLNTEISVRGDQRGWLEKELAATRPEKRWLVVHYHRPAYPVAQSFNHDTAPRLREAWVPLFEKYNIDLAAESDGHILKRTLPIRNNKPDETGIVYVGEGGLGVPQRVVDDTTRWYIQPPGFAASADNVFMFTFRQDSLLVTAYGADGNVLDEYGRIPRQ
ncbi:metallophosphoesterase family protein [soil metagenome]